LLFLGQPDYVAQSLQKSLARISVQFAVDGSQPFEMARNDSWRYHVYNLEAHFVLSELAKNVNIDYLNYKTNDGRSILSGLDYLMPFALSNGTGWPATTDLPGGFQTKDLVELAKVAYVTTRNVKYKEFVDKLQPQAYVSNPSRLWNPFGSFDFDSSSVPVCLSVSLFVTISMMYLLF
jgi:hypothetical protein